MLRPMETPAILLRILRRGRPAWAWGPLLAASAFAVACSGPKPAAPDAFVAATVGVGPESPNSVCQLGSVAQWLDIGTEVGTEPTHVVDGDSQSGSAVHVTCTVATSGAGFDINLNATLEGLQGGSLTITSPSGQGAVTSSGATGITAVFQSGQNGTFHASDCTITYTYAGDPIQQQYAPFVAAGRIWGPDAQSSGGQTVTTDDGGTGPRQCDGEADFLFEQCGS
jgi:hypothetical protein